MIELVVERNPGETRIAVREDGRTVEVRLDRDGRSSRVGAIHLGRVVRIEPGVGAFVDIGAEAPAFLPAAAESPVEGAAITVQVAKDAVGGKGTEVTRALMLDGGPLSLTPAQPGLAISRRLPETLRKRLRARLGALVEEGPGLLVRSSACERDDLEGVRRDLLDQWRRVEARLGETPPRLLWTPPDLVASLIAQLHPDRLVAGDAGTAAKWRAGPLPVDKVERPFETLGIEDELARSLAREIAIPGGRLLVEEGETLTAIDVNGAGDRLELCLAAAREIGRLIRLRDLAGTLVVDFPFIERKPERDRVDAALKAAVAGDSRPVECLGWTRAGLYEMTRRRLRASLAAQVAATPAATAALAALRALSRAEGGRFRLVAAPDVVAWLEGDGASALAEAGRAVALVADAGYGREKFDLVRE